MSDREKKIAEIRENHSTGHYNYNYEVRDAIRFLLDELERVNRERNKLIEGLRWYGKTSRYSFRRNGSVDVLADSGQRARNALKEIGVRVE